jgi:LysM repeat protein
MYRYSNNAFRVLGLKPDASLPEIKKRVNEIKVKTSLGQDIRYEYDFPFLGPINREEENILNALQRLEDPITRLKEEIFWFWIETDDDKDAIDCLIEGDITEARNIWNRQLTEDGLNINISALVNQIILGHSTAIAESVRILDNEKGAKDKKGKDNWKAIINSLVLLNNNDSFWDSIYRKAERISDSRLTPDKIDKIKERFLSDVLQPNFMLISQALNKKEYEIVKYQADLFHNTSLPEDLRIPTKILTKGFNQILSYHIKTLNDYTNNVKTQFNKIDKDKTDLNKYVNSIISLYNRYDKKIGNIIFEGFIIDKNNITDFALAKDKVAEMINVMSVSMFNSLVEEHSFLKRNTALRKSLAMIKKASGYATTNYTKQKIKKNENVINRSLQNILEQDKPDNVIDKKQKDVQSQTKSKQEDKKEKLSTPKRIPVLVYFALSIILLVLLFSFEIPSNPPSSKARTTSSSTTKTSAQTTSTSSTNYSSKKDLEQLLLTINKLEDTIINKEKALEEMESELNRKDAIINKMKSILEDIKSKLNYSFSQSEKNKLANEHKQIFEQYEIQFNSYQNLYSSYEKLYSEYEDDIDLYNKLVFYYNTGIIPPNISYDIPQNKENPIIYKVKSGDSLSKIARQFNTTVEAIVIKNNLINPNIIRPGQELIIPKK